MKTLLKMLGFVSTVTVCINARDVAHIHDYISRGFSVQFCGAVALLTKVI